MWNLEEIETNFEVSPICFSHCGSKLSSKFCQTVRGIRAPLMPHPNLFQFELRPVMEVDTWGNDAGKYLNWYGLTDGWYTMNCGGTELMRYNQKLIDATKDRNWPSPYFNYYVGRLYEDLLDVLPSAIEPIPSDLLELVRTPEAENLFAERSYRWSDQYWPPRDPNAPYVHPIEHLQFWDRAAGWWLENCQLSRGHTMGQPKIRLWTEGEMLSIRWINDCGVEPTTGLPWTNVSDGLHTMPLSQFMDEVRSFHDRLMNAMSLRVEQARTAWPRPDVAIDIDALMAEHQERTQSLDQVLRSAAESPRNWDSVREAVDKVIRLVGN